jgi:hypothetical protein
LKSNSPKLPNRPESGHAWPIRTGWNQKQKGIALQITGQQPETEQKQNGKQAGYNKTDYWPNKA